MIAPQRRFCNLGSSALEYILRFVDACRCGSTGPRFPKSIKVQLLKNADNIRCSQGSPVRFTWIAYFLGSCDLTIQFRRKTRSHLFKIRFPRHAIAAGHIAGGTSRSCTRQDTLRFSDLRPYLSFFLLRSNRMADIALNTNVIMSKKSARYITTSCRLSSMTTWRDKKVVANHVYI